MIESFHAVGCLGYTRRDDPGSEWTISSTPETLHDSECIVFSEVSSVSQSSSIQPTWVERIRGESLRCLYLLIRQVDQPFQLSPLTLLEDAGNRPGLSTLVRLDPSYHVRRFAMFSMVYLLRSFQTRNLLPSNMRFRTASHELAGLEINVLRALGGLLTSNDKQDWSTVEHILIDVISSATWKRMGPIHHYVLRALIGRIDAASGPSRRIFLVGLSSIMEKGNPPDDILDTCVQVLATWTDDDPGNILAVNRLLAKLHGRLPRAIVQSQVVEGLRYCLELLELKSIERSVTDQMCACFENIGLLADLNPDSQHLIRTLTERVPNQCQAALILGLGRLSRHSQDTVRFVLSLSLNGLVTTVSPPVIRGIGDIVFSASIFAECVHFNPFEEWIKIDKVRGPVLRAMMTGLSRIHSSGESYSENSLFNCIISDCERLLSDVWCSVDIAVDEKVFSDSIRCIGLLNRVRIPTDSFRKSSSLIVLDALRSGKTQRILAALASINTGQQHLDLENGSTLVHGLCCEYLRRLEENTRWDYESAESVGGTLHVIHDCMTSLEQVSSRDIQNRVRSLLKNGKMHKMKAYSSSMITILDRLDRLCSSES